MLVLGIFVLIMSLVVMVEEDIIELDKMQIEDWVIDINFYVEFGVFYKVRVLSDVCYVKLLVEIL